MPTIKPTKDGILRRIETIAYLKQKRDRLDVMAKGRESDFWKAQKFFIQESIDRNANLIDAILNSDSEEPADGLYARLKKAYGSKVQAEALLSLVETPEEIYTSISTKIKSLQEEIKDAENSGVLQEENA